MDESISIVIGAVLPPIIDIINVNVLNEKVRYIISLVIPLALGALLNLQALSTGDVLSVLEAGGLIFASAQTVYKTYWEKSSKRAEVFAK